jgi:chemotaxis protein histidine kinase CheA
MFELLTTVIEAIDVCELAVDSDQKELIKTFKSIYKKFACEFSSEEDYENWQSQWAEFCGNREQEEELLIDASDFNRLLEILMEIEDVYLPGFSQRLHSMYLEDKQDVRDETEAHFRKLNQNSGLIGLENLRNISGQFVKICKPEFEFNPSEEQIETLSNIYLTCIQRFKERGIEADISDMISDFETMMEPESEGPEEPDEDLVEIFKEEGNNYLDIIENALETLGRDNNNREQYEIIEKNIHSLKSSARLMGFADVVDLAIPIEEKCEEFNSKNIVTDNDSLPLFKEMIDGIRQLVAGQKVDTETLKEKIANIHEIELDTSETELFSETLEKAPPETEGDEKPLFIEPADEDAEMLAIFKEEASEYINTIDQANKELKDDPENKEALHKQEYASHSLKSAAMMLGFREIGQIANAIEQVMESINKSELLNNIGINDRVNQAIELVKSITGGSTVEPDAIADVLNVLDIGHLKQEYKSPVKSVDKDETIEIGSMGELFLKEAWEFIGKINRELVNLEKDAQNIPLIDEINRTVHTLKGSAQMMTFVKIGKIAHGIEDYLENVKVNPERKIDPVFEGLDEIQRLMRNIKSGKGEKSDNYNSVLEKLSIEEEQQKENSVVKSSINDSEQAIIEEHDEQSVRVRTRHLDSMINLAADLIVNKTTLSNHLDELKGISEQIEKERKVLKSAPKDSSGISGEDNFLEGQALKDHVNKIEADYQNIIGTYNTVSSKFSQLTQNLEESLSQISILTKHLHDDILKTRMVPVETLFNRFPRAVRDIAHKQNKKVTLVVEGEDTELDRALVEQLSDPVMHLLRNAIDHGIELPEDRIKANKGEDGILLLKAKQERNQVLIEVQDDGRGLNMDKIKETIIARNLATPVEVSEKNVNELIGYIFTPGFTTSGNVSDISGRGIGLDAVLADVCKLKGDIRVNVTPGKGTTFSIRVPLSLLILQALLFEVGDETFAIPLASVLESVLFESKKIRKESDKFYYKVDKNEIQVLDLSQLLNIKREDDEKQNIILLEEAGSKFGIMVDRVVGRQDVVIKSIGDQLNDVPYISGGTIIGDGSVCLILDILALSRDVSDQGQGSVQDISSIEKARKLLDKNANDPLVAGDSTSKKSALIVDDSISVRTFVSTVLSRNNFNTILASNGVEAIELLKGGEFDLVLTDLEMPKLDGFEFIKQLRQMDKYKEVPVIILSGRASRKHQDKGQKLGANAFIVKPFKESDLLNTIEQFIKWE